MPPRPAAVRVPARSGPCYAAGMAKDATEDRMQKIVSLCKRRGFVFQNPSATGSCGCGTSFSA